MSGNKKKLVYAQQDLTDIVKELKKLMATYQIFAFTGPLGAGKTTMIQHLLRECGVLTPITSPTFMYVNEYANNQGEKFFHFDLYRIKDVHEFQDQGFDEYLYQPNSWAFIEWPEVIKPLLTHNVCHITLDYHEDLDKRVAVIEYIE